MSIKSGWRTRSEPRDEDVYARRASAPRPAAARAPESAKTDGAKCAGGTELKTSATAASRTLGQPVLPRNERDRQQSHAPEVASLMPLSMALVALSATLASALVAVWPAPTALSVAVPAAPATALVPVVRAPPAAPESESYAESTTDARDVATEPMADVASAPWDAAQLVA